MRFLHLTTFYPPWNFGGDGVFVQQLAQALLRDGHHVEVVHCLDAYRTLSPSISKFNEIPTDDGVIVHSMKSVWGALSPVGTHQTGYPMFKAGRLREILNRDFDVIHFHNTSLLGPKAFELVPKSNRSVSFHTSHELWLVCPTHTLWKNDSKICDKRTCISCTLRYKRPPQWWRYTGMLNRASLCIDQFLAPSEFVARTLRDHGFNYPVDYLPNFAADDLDCPKDHTLDQAKSYVFYAGRLEPIKGLNFAIRAWSMIPDIELVIAGSGMQQGELQQLASSNPRIKFLGRLPRESLGRWYSGALATIVPSVGFENCPLACLESFSCRTPVLGYSQAGVKELIEKSNGGLLYQTPEQLKTAVQWLRDDPLLRDRLASNGFEAWKANWNERSHLNQYYKIIERVQSLKRKR
jgi:glycosyltransferase involved in cell wall biosynthesis